MPALRAPESQRTLNDLRRELEHHGIRAEQQEIAAALLEALLARPVLCRGLLAAYLMGAEA